MIMMMMTTMMKVVKITQKTNNLKLNRKMIKKLIFFRQVKQVSYFNFTVCVRMILHMYNVLV